MFIELPPYTAATAHLPAGLDPEPDTQHTLTLDRTASHGGRAKATRPRSAGHWPMHLRMPDGMRGQALTYTHPSQPGKVASAGAAAD